MDQHFAVEGTRLRPLETFGLFSASVDSSFLENDCSSADPVAAAALLVDGTSTGSTARFFLSRDSGGLLAQSKNMTESVTRFM